MSTLVTGEAVALDLRLARFPSRAVALAIDIMVQLAILFGVLLLLGLVADSIDDTLGIAISLAAFVLVIIGVPTLVETLTRGRSLGKLVFGLRVVRDDGGPTRFRHAFVRALCAFFIDIWLTLGSVGCIASLLSVNGKRVGDQFAGTVVVRERVPVPASVQSTTVWMPPALAGWAAMADISRVPDDLALMARQFVGRAPSLDPGTRTAMAADIAGQVARYVAPSSPPGTPAEAYLAAVVAERSRRAHLQDAARPSPSPSAPAAPHAAAGPYPVAAAPLTAPAPSPTPPPGAAAPPTSAGFTPPW